MKKFTMILALLTAAFLLASTASAADVFNSSKSNVAHEVADAQADEKKVILDKEKEPAAEARKAKEEASKKAAPGGY